MIVPAQTAHSGGDSILNFQFGTEKIAVNVADKPDLWRKIRARFAAKDGFALATMNVDHLVKLSSNPDFRRAYSAQDFVVADGNPVVWLSRLAHDPVSLIPGSELVVPLSKLAAENGIKVALVGSTEQVLKDAANALTRAVPGLVISAQIAPAFGFDPEGRDAENIYDVLNASGAGLCFLALSAPKQEQFAARGREFSPTVGFVSIGAGLDFLAGVQIRAPKWVRAIAMEWAWRLMLSPRRLFARYAACAWILPRHAIIALRQQRH